MLKVWNACLIVATFSLALLGTFLVRSGVLQSIHAFGDSTVGPYILGLIGGRPDRLDGADRLPPRRPALRASGSTRWSPARRSSWSTTCCWWRSAWRSSGAPSSRSSPSSSPARSPRSRRPGSTATRRRWRSCSSSSPGSGRCSPGAGSAGPRRSGSSSCPRRGRPPRSASLLVATSAGEQALGPGAVRLRRLRPDRAGAGVLARRRRRGARSPAARCRRRWSASSPATAAATAATSSTSASPCC